ncbi:MAG TPA: GtrA family protein [Rhizomicrobium sp.]|nr:GtrA family protein [Rhizomicrobium sp.]
MSSAERQGKTALLLKELAAFLLFGGLAAVTNLAVGWQLYGRGLFPDLPYWCATALAAMSGLVVNFGLNYVFNFKFRRRSAFRQFSTFCIVALIGVAITSGLSSGIVSLLHSWAGPVLNLGGFEVKSAFAAHFTAVGLTVLYSFPAHKFMSFNIGIRAQVLHLHARASGSESSVPEQV